MSDFFVGEIRVFPFNWAPNGWALCNGASLPIQQNAALYALLGVQFGGNAQTNFNLPDLQGRAPLCAGNSPTYGNYANGIANKGGVESVALTTAQVPIHTHSFKAVSAAGTSSVPVADGFVASAKPGTTTPPVPTLYGSVTAASPPTLAPVNGGTLGTVGGGAHNNMQPFIVMNFCISTTGLFPSRP